MAYTPIQPLPTTKPFLETVSEGLSYIRQVNELKRKNSEKRQFEIIKLLEDVDFPTAVNMANQERQMQLRDAAESSLMRILSRSAKRNGQVTPKERLEADRVIKTLEQELSAITVGEKEFGELMELTAKKPGYYTPESLKEYSDSYINTGESKKDLLKIASVPFSVMQSNMYDMFKKDKKTTSVIAGDNEITKETYGMPLEEKKANYEAMVNEIPGFAQTEKESFQELKESNPDMYSKYFIPGMTEKEAAREWALENIAPQLLEDRVIKQEDLRARKGKDTTPKILKPTKTNDFIVWDAGADASSYSGKIKTAEGEEQVVMNGKVTKVIYDKNTGQGFVEITAKVKPYTAPPEQTGDEMLDGIRAMQHSLSQQGSAETRTFMLPYNENREMVNSIYNLQGGDIFGKYVAPKKKVEEKQVEEPELKPDYNKEQEEFLKSIGTK